MIDVLTNKIVFADKEEKILTWTIWYQTPFGLCKDLYDAVKLMQDNNLDPRVTINPVPVACSQTMTELWPR